MKKQCILLFLAFIISHVTFGQQFSKAQVLSDLNYLRTSLEATHYNLFAYTTEQEFEQNYQAIRQRIQQDSITLSESILLFQQVISKANTGHAEIDFPIATYRNYAMNGGTLFPLELAFEDGKAFIRKNFSTQESLKLGLEVLSIDGQPIQNIVKKIHPQLSAESTYFKNAKLELFSFPRMYWQVFGKKEVFMVTIKENDQIKTISTTAIDLINDYESKRDELFSAGYSLTFYDRAAYLNPGSFSGDEMAYRAFIDSAFHEISQNKSTQLIIDLRNNTGGHDAFSNHLIAYFANQPFKWCAEFSLKSSQLLKEQTRTRQDTTDKYSRAILDLEDGKTAAYGFDVTQPYEVSKRFKGKVYVLVNRHSYSMAAVSAAMLQDNGFATVVGETTGDFPSLYASQFSYVLPQTGITVKVPKGYMIRPNGSQKRIGVVPDIIIKDHLVDEKDEILEGLLKRLAGN